MRVEIQRSWRQTERVSSGEKRNRKREQWESEKPRETVGARVKRGETDASHPAARSECNSWPGADAGLLGVFIDLQDFNPQYWPKLLAEGCWPT